MYRFLSLQNDALTSLNQTLQTKCEELEQITFLYDERELEIREVRDSLEDYHNQRRSIEDTVTKKTTQIEELQSEVECLMNELLETKSAQGDTNNHVVELRQIIKEQEAELIKLGDKLKNSIQPSSSESSQLQEIEASLQQLKNDLLEATGARDEISKQNVELKNCLNEREEEFEKERHEIEFKNVELQNLLIEREEEYKKSTSISACDQGKNGATTL